MECGWIGSSYDTLFQDCPQHKTTVETLSTLTQRLLGTAPSATLTTLALNGMTVTFPNVVSYHIYRSYHSYHSCCDMDILLHVMNMYMISLHVNLRLSVAAFYRFQGSL